ncbi:MAG: YsnF/AvaK domain-containing protein [Bryobacteraceae bacterium]
MSDPLETGNGKDRDDIVVPVLSEQLKVDIVSVPVGGVRVIKRVVEEQVPIDEQLRSQEAEVERVPVGRYVEGPLPVRQSDDALIVPIVEEHVVVERRWFLKEEIHIKRTEQTIRYEDTVTVKHEEATIERLDIEPHA